MFIASCVVSTTESASCTGRLHEQRAVTALVDLAAEAAEPAAENGGALDDVNRRVPPSRSARAKCSRHPRTIARNETSCPGIMHRQA